MLFLNPFHGRSEEIFEDCLGAILARSWYTAGSPPSHANIGVQHEWLSLLLSDRKLVRAATLHVAYSQCRAQIMDDIMDDIDNKVALGTLERQRYQLQCSVTPIHCLPAEILMEIFYTALHIGEARTRLAQVCRRWWKTIEGMPNIWASLELGARTTSEFVLQSLSRAGEQPLAVEINITGDRSTVEGGYPALSIAVDSASKWRSLTITSLPQHRQDVQYADHPLSKHFPLMNRLKHLKVMEPTPSPLLHQLLQNVATAAMGSLTSMDISSSPAIQYLVQPSHALIFHSLTTFHAKVPKMEYPVDVLPHFMQLEVLDLTSLLLPVHDNGAPLPLARTLHHLYLRGVSIQWMGRQDFAQLESCTIIAPMSSPSLEYDVHLPVCTELHFENWNTPSVGQIHVPVLGHLRVKSNAWNPERGHEGVLQICRAGLGTGWKPRSLSLSVGCKDTVLLGILRFLPALEELRLDLPRPSILGKHFFIGLLAKPVTGKLELDWKQLYLQDQTGWKPALCPSLKVLELKYQRWLRPGDNHGFLLPLFVLSWSRKKATPLQFHVHFKSSLHSWASFELTPEAALVLSQLHIPGHDQVTHLSLITEHWWEGLYETPHFTPFFNYLQVLRIHREGQGTVALRILPSFHQLRELSLFRIQVPPLAHGTDLPCAHTLQKLSLRGSTVGWMDGLVFTQLKKFVVDEEGWPESFEQKVVMPVCTHIGFGQYGEYKLEILPVMLDYFQFPLLDTWELQQAWRESLFDHRSISALRMIQAKCFYFKIFHDYGQLLELLETKDEVEQLELVFLKHNEQSALAGMALVGNITRKLPCPNMKVLKLWHLSTEDGQRKQVIQWCMQMMTNRRLVGQSIEKCCIWWEETEWEKDAALVLIMQNEEVIVV